MGKKGWATTVDDGGWQGNQSGLYESEVAIEAESREASHMLNTGEGEEQRGEVQYCNILSLHKL